MIPIRKLLLGRPSGQVTNRGTMAKPLFVEYLVQIAQHMNR